MGGPGSGRYRPKTEQDDPELVARRRSVRIAARATPELMEQAVVKAKAGDKFYWKEVMDRGIGKAAAQLDVNVNGAVLVLTPEDVLRQRELLAAQDTLLLGDGS